MCIVFLFVKGTFLKPLQRKVDEHLRMEKAECLGKGKAGKEVEKVDKELLNRQEENWSPKAAVYSSVYSGQTQSQPRQRTGGSGKHELKSKHVAIPVGLLHVSLLLLPITSRSKGIMCRLTPNTLFTSSKETK